MSDFSCEVLKVLWSSEPDEKGRRLPIPFLGSEEIREVDSIIMAPGLVPDLSWMELPDENVKPHVLPGGTIIASPQSFRTSEKGVFAGGDVVRGRCGRSDGR